MVEFDLKWHGFYLHHHDKKREGVLMIQDVEFISLIA